MAYISRLEIGNVVLRPARLEVGHYDSAGPYTMIAGDRTAGLDPALSAIIEDQGRLHALQMLGIITNQS